MASDAERSPQSRAAGTLKPVRRANLPTAIADQLRRQIAEGEFGPGRQLPGHRELAAIFGVSVGTLREAISMLVAEGRIEARAGWGTFVAESPSPRSSGESSVPQMRQELAELVEARETIELQLVGLAAERATPRQIEEMKAALALMADAAADPRGYGDADFNFHLKLAEAAHNRFLMKATVEIRERLKSDIEMSLEALVRRFGDVTFSVEQHRELVEAVESGEVDRARAIALELMNRNHDFLMSLYGLASRSAPVRQLGSASVQNSNRFQLDEGTTTQGSPGLPE